MNRHVPLSAYWPHEARLIRRLAAGSTLEERFRTLEEELLASSFRPLERHPAVVYAMEELRRSSVAKVLERTGLSHRRFNERFKAQVGMTPKQLSRLYRFQEVLSALNQGEQPDWASIAEACGYCDQAHLIRDFQAFSGMPPSRYRRIPERHPNHSPYPR
ncbi:helix-turn-helix domain-containing protein [Paenibacillus sp. CC-CFT747]|nr:helix-turn-helix domain-containing protein [Paenibacillus sp. CC-CFT747]